MIALHKAVTDAGGAIGIEIESGEIDALIPPIKTLDQTNGVVISRKFYLKNTEPRAISGTLTLMTVDPFSGIIFEGSGSSQVVGDLTGSETNESPIAFALAVDEAKSFWLQVTVPALSTETKNYIKATKKIAY